MFFGIIAAVILLASVGSVKAITCLSDEYNDNGVCRKIPSRSLQLILDGYCKVGQVEYTAWSECDKRFGKTGFQYRDIILPTKNGCVPSTYDQVARQRDCLK